MYYVDFCRAKTGYWVGWTEYNNATFFTAASTLDELVHRMKVKLYNKYRMSASSIIIAEKQSQVEDCPYYLMSATFLKRYWGEENVFKPREESVCTTVDNPKPIKHKSPKQTKTMQDVSLYDRVTYEEQDGKLIVYGIMKIAEYPLKKYKSYNDLEWKQHLLAIEAQGKDFLSKNKDAKHAVIIFDNGYGVSVVRDCPLITDIYNFEIAVIKGTRESYSLVYDTGITDDVIRCNTEKEVSDIMKQVQDLPKKA